MSAEGKSIQSVDFSFANRIKFHREILAVCESIVVVIFYVIIIIKNYDKRKKLHITSALNEVTFFLEILGNPKISELKNGIWVKIGKSLGDLA